VEIVLGKAAAAWGVALVFLAVSLPLALWCVLEGGVGWARLAIVTALQAVLLGVVVAISLGLSALLARTTTSSVLAYLAVVALTLGTLVAFGIATQLTQEQRRVSYSSPEGTGDYTTTVTHSERVWWLLAPNPVVIVADASPLPPRARQAGFFSSRPPALEDLAPEDPLTALRRTVRGLRVPPYEPPPSGIGLQGTEEGQQVDGPVSAGPPVWPTGLAVDVVLAATALGLATRRLRTPARRLPRGQRVA